MTVGIFFALSSAALFLFMAGLIGSDIDLGWPVAIMTLIGIALMILGMFLAIRSCDSYGYYLPCEIVATNETSTYFGTVDQDNQQIYAVETGNHIWPDDVPYLLHMDGKKTETVTDDEVLMVWRAD